MLDWIGGFASTRFIRNPIFIVGGSRSGTSPTSSNGRFYGFILDESEAPA